MLAEGLELRAGLWVQGERGRYRLDRPLGEGGFGHAWAATAEDGAGVVVKQLKLQRMDDWKALELFEREARVLASLSHPNVPAHLEFFAHDGSAPHPVASLAELDRGSLVSIYVRVEGRSLEEHIASGQVLDGAALVRLLDRLLEVLGYLHGLQPPVIHRDIKPANVIVDAHGEPHLVDFGAIKNHAREGSTTVGTFGYFPMEQMMGQSQPASDLYALGMTTLVVATRVRPEDMPLDEQTGKVNLQQVAPGLPPGVGAALDRMLEPIVGKRVRTASEARSILTNPVQALAHPTSAALTPAHAKTLRVANICLAAGGGSAALLYIVFFDSFSETALVQLSALWIAPVIYGLAAHVMVGLRKTNAGSQAAAITGIGLLMLIVFFFAIWPSL
ncbi:MAG: serine/threonine-protein kinase [Myxococcota bacterium]